MLKTPPQPPRKPRPTQTVPQRPSSPLARTNSVRPVETRSDIRPSRSNNYDKPGSSFKKIALVLGPILIAVFIAIGFWTVSYKSNLKALNADATEQNIIIEPGTGAQAIATLLEEKNIIKSSSAFNNYLRFNGLSSSLQAGGYDLSSSMTVQEIVDIIGSGKVSSKTVLIAPGLTVNDIKKVFVDAGYPQAEVEEAFNTIKPRDHINGVNAESLEGYIAPDTYKIGSDFTAEDLLILTLDEFEKQLNPEILAGFSEQGLSINGATILASIVQLESSLPENQEKIAQVFIRRIDEGIPLGADPTFRYASEQLGIEDNIDVDSPYNTRINVGFPPTPIANFNLSALQSVAYPADTNYLFFVSGDDGVTYFSNTLQEHNRLAEEHCVELCSL